MKNQYFGDVNDYRKYGLLRILTGQGGLSTAVCWMLTPDDGRTDGRFVEYLQQPERWRGYDPALFDRLREMIALREERDIDLVDLAGEAGILPSARFFVRTLRDDRQSRSRYFEVFWSVAEGCDLIFFDPDNGLEVKSRRLGCKGSSKYLYWDELVQACSSGYSVLVYQHFRREKRDAFVERMAHELAHRTGAAPVYSFRTARVVFFLMPAERQAAALEQNVVCLSEIWGDQISVRRFEGD
jgi:hypothetical protein